MDIKHNKNTGRVMDVRSRSTTPDSPKTNKRPSSRWLVIVGALLVLALAGLAAYKLLDVGSSVDRSKYQAVFLTNGQVYFGKLSGWGGAQPTLTEVYYFQSNDNADIDATSGGEQSLIKLGEEIHKPSDQMIFNRDSILFVENIEDEGQVVQAIKQHKKED